MAPAYLTAVVQSHVWSLHVVLHSYILQRLMYAQVIDILMTADLSGDGRVGPDGMAGHAGPSPAGWGQTSSPHTQHQGAPHHQVSKLACAE